MPASRLVTPCSAAMTAHCPVRTFSSVARVDRRLGVPAKDTTFIRAGIEARQTNVGRVYGGSVRSQP